MQDNADMCCNLFDFGPYFIDKYFEGFLGLTVSFSRPNLGYCRILIPARVIQTVQS